MLFVLVDGASEDRRAKSEERLLGQVTLYQVWSGWLDFDFTAYLS